MIKPTPRSCQICGRTFSSARPEARHCSSACVAVAQRGNGAAVRRARAAIAAAGRPLTYRELALACYGSDGMRETERVRQVAYRERRSGRPLAARPDALGPVTQAVLDAIRAAGGTWIDRETVACTVYGLDGPAERQAIRSAVWRLRRRGVQIEADDTHGYRIQLDAHRRTA